MFRRVLVPLDGSHLAQMALDYTTKMVDPTCEIVLVTAVLRPEIPLYSMTPVVSMNPEYTDVEALRKSAKSYLEGVAAKLLERGFHVTIRVEVDEAAHAIVQAANALDVDAIIMSTHGRSGVSRWLFGSVTARVLGMAARPVLVVPSGEPHQKFERENAEMKMS
jgi:nucleotide-binding universal stress UspA family protein